ncbi:MAG: response regulator [Methylococcaceae bacterium]|nr:MAG: response regulator [Methylococcaceae bacterium]
MALWSLSKQKLLIVDDFPDMRGMMRSIVTSMGATDIQTASNGDEAVSLIEFNRFNIILCDYNLGDGKDGQQVLEEVRYRELLPFTTIFIMVTAENSALMVHGALEYAPDDYLSKPVTRATLIARLRHLMVRKERLSPVLAAMDRRCFPEALKQCEALLEAGNEGRHDLLQLKGRLLTEIGEYDAACAFYQETLRERSLPWMMLGLGRAQVYTQQYAQAIEVLEGLIQVQPGLCLAYDLLAEALAGQGELARAQEVVMQAIAVSPKPSMRHRYLGQLAYRQGNFEAAENAFRTALRLSKGSYLRSFAEYTDLARAQIMKGDVMSAMKALRDMQREYKQDACVKAQSALLEWAAQCKNGGGEAATQLSDEVAEQFNKQPELISSDIAWFVGKLCLESGKTDFAKSLLRHVLINQPDNPVIHEQVLEAFAGAGLGAEGKAAVNSVNAELDKLYQDGSHLARLGQLEEAIAFFEQAAQPLPENKNINLAVVDYLIRFMQKHGKTPELMQKARTYLERIRRMAENTAQYRRLKSQLNQIAASV